MADHLNEIGSDLPTFVARLWLEHGPDRSVSWRGRVKHVQSNREAYFGTFEQLGDFLREVSGVPEPQKNDNPANRQPETDR